MSRNPSLSIVPSNMDTSVLYICSSVILLHSSGHPGLFQNEKLSSKRCCSSKMENFSQLCLCCFEINEELVGQSN